MPQFHLLAFEGPDAYSRAGGLGTRVSGLSEALAAEGFDTHLWFVGDPDLPGQERRGRLALHRWCQWISRHHPAGVYDGEEGKHADYASSLPPFLFHNELLPRLRAGARAVVLAEEWQTADAVLHLDSLLRRAGLRDRVTILWNANNLFGFHHIDWRRLAAAATVTTVSRYMRYRMWELGIDPVVIPNGLSSRALRPPDQQALGAVAARTAGRVVVTKVARWDPDKRWLLAVDIAAEMKRRGSRPLLVARGGVESHGVDVLARATAAGLRVADRSPTRSGLAGLIDDFADLCDIDVVNLRHHVSSDARQVLFRHSAAVLANSGHEPFGMVGLETMAAGGVACTGGTGEDYAIPGWNTLVLQVDQPVEFLQMFGRLRSDQAAERALRRAGQATARQYAWPEIIRRNLLPRVLGLASGDGAGRPRYATRQPRHGRRPVSDQRIAAVPAHQGGQGPLAVGQRHGPTGNPG